MHKKETDVTWGKFYCYPNFDLSGFDKYQIKITEYFTSGDDSITLPDTPQPDEDGATYREKLCTRSKLDIF